MDFDRQLAEQLLRHRDRDKARFFAGRRREIKAFEDALLEAADFESAAFRIYQGPPGCGKTSLAKHLADTHDVLFVECRAGDMSNDDALLGKIREGARVRAGATRQLGGAALETAAERLKVETFAQAVRDVMGRTGRTRPVVLHMDEAHGRVNAGRPGVGETLLDLHTVGIGVPCVMLLTGLEHTAQRIQGIPGLSRLPDTAKHRVERLDEDECADSTRKMLDALGARGDKVRAARKVAGMAFGWPQHLHCAQQELVYELIEHDGRLDRVDWKAVDERTAGRRERYYEARLDDTIFKVSRKTTWRILHDVHRGASDADYRALVEVIDGRFEREGVRRLHERMGADATAMAKALHEKGILTEHGETGWEIAVPSMADWVERMVGRT